MRVIMYPAVTLDGFIADSKGECYSWISEADEAYYNQAVEKAGCLLIGRKTFEQYPEDFPKPNAQTFVYTSQAGLQDQPGITFVRGTPAEVVRLIAGQGFSELIVGGGGAVNGSLAAAGLVDEIIVSIYGVLLGAGLPLFGAHRPQLNLRLLSSKQEIKGIVKNHYEVLRPSAPSG